MATPEDYIPLCEKLGWPEWANEEEGVQFHERLKPWPGQRSHKWWIEWAVGNSVWHRQSHACPHVALCILEKWAREKLEEAGMTRTLHYVDGRTRDVVWKDSQIVAVGDTEAEAQIAALKTLCKENNDGD